MDTLKSAFCQVNNTPNLLSESKKMHLKHLFEDGTLTFDDMRSIFNNVFTGKVGISTKVKRIPLQVTYKDGGFAFADAKTDLKAPYAIDSLCKRCKCGKDSREAVRSTLSDLVARLSKLEQKDLNSVFANGQNYYAIDVVVPPEENLADYGGKCFLECDKINSYDSSFETIAEDEEGSAKVDGLLKKDLICGSAKQISEEAIECLKSSTSPDVALRDLLDRLAELVDGIGYRATVNDYVRERYAKHIVNKAMERGIDLYHNSDFVNELIARLSHVSNHRPSRSDLMTYAKRDGVDFRSPEYRDLMADLDSNAEETNDEIIKPIEELVLHAGILIMKCFLGMVAVDPRKLASKMKFEIGNTIDTLEADAEGLTPEKIKVFRKCMKNLDAYQTSLPKDGILIFHNGKVAKISGDFGAISNIVKLMNY